MSYKIAGPWRVEVVCGGTDPVLIVKDANDNYVGKFHTYQDANIAAASPDLLEFSKFVLRFNGSSRGLKGLVEEFKVRAAIVISKAEGR